MIDCLDDIRIGRKEFAGMTTLATTIDARMSRNQERGRGKRDSGVVTYTAFGLRRNVVDLLRRGDTGVVAGCTVVGIYTQVVERDTRKAREVVDVVAGRAVEAGRQVVARLSDADPAVMTGRTVVDVYAHVIELRTGKVDGVMAYGAVGGGRQVIGALADTDHRVVA